MDLEGGGKNNAYNDYGNFKLPHNIGFASLLANPIFSRKHRIAPQHIGKIVENDKNHRAVCRYGLHKSIDIIIRQNLQKKQFWLKKLEFI